MKENRNSRKSYQSYCTNCACNWETGYMTPLEPEQPSSDKVLYVLYDFETTQSTLFSETAPVHAPYLVCVQQVCVLAAKGNQRLSGIVSSAEKGNIRSWKKIPG
jgi:hypothetical protein